MIDKNKIKSAAQGYCDATYGTLNTNPFIAEAFRKGANWAINEFLENLWHPVSKEPEENRNILVEHKCGDLHYYTKNYDCYYKDPWDAKVRILNITRWLYIDDLLPKEEDTHD